MRLARLTARALVLLFALATLAAAFNTTLLEFLDSTRRRGLR